MSIIQRALEAFQIDKDAKRHNNLSQRQKNSIPARNLVHKILGAEPEFIESDHANTFEFELDGLRFTVGFVGLIPRLYVRAWIGNEYGGGFEAWEGFENMKELGEVLERSDKIARYERKKTCRYCGCRKWVMSSLDKVMCAGCGAEAGY